MPEETKQPSTFTVHYHRKDGDYTDASLWVWGSMPNGADHAEEVRAAREDDFGQVFEIDASKFGGRGAQPRGIGYVPRIRNSWELKDGPDRFWYPKQGNQIWIIEGDPKVYTKRPEIRREIYNAVQDAPRRIVLALSHRIDQASVAPRLVTLAGERGRAVSVAEIRPHDIRLGRVAALEIFTDDDVDCIAERIEVRIEGFEPTVILPRHVQYHPERFSYDRGDANAPGAHYSAKATTFRLFSPAARAAMVILFDEWESDAGRREVAMDYAGKGVWQVRIEGDLEGKFYALRVDTHRTSPGPEVVDPFAINTVGREDRARITDLRKTDPEGFRPIKRPTPIEHPVDAVIYEMSVRDFTISPQSGVAEERRGKFLGVVEPDTHLPGEERIKTGLAHLRELGVTHVQILPVQDFDNDEQDPEYNWGYMTAFFNSPEGWYASDIRGPERIIELKRMVQLLHEAGLGVILDVVYNHTGVQNTFEKIAPHYYHRQWPFAGFSNGSGTGNEVFSSVPMARRFLRDSMRYWVEEYGVDGFRLDLMGLMDIDTLIQVRDELKKIHPHLLFYGEPWTGGDSAIWQVTDKGVVSGTGIGAFNDNFRNALKGEPNGSHAGYVQNSSHRDAVIRGIAGSIDDWAAQPGETINYATCHDNLTMWDKLAESSREPEAERVRMATLAAAILLVSQGIPFLHGGHEFLRTKGGEHNSYNLPDEVNQFDWARKQQYLDVAEYIARLIALRRAHPAFRLRSADDIRHRIHFHHDALPAGEAILFTLDAHGLKGETWHQVAVAINPLGRPLKFHLPDEGVWRIHADGLEASPDKPLGTASGVLEVPRRSLAIVAQ